MRVAPPRQSSSAGDPLSSPPIPVGSNEGAFDPSVRWFQHAVFYEVLIRGYHDANNDGTGDLRGLREKLDEGLHDMEVEIKIRASREYNTSVAHDCENIR